MKRPFRTFYLWIAVVVFPLVGSTSWIEPEDAVDKIILDAGHGGKDPGNLGTGRYARKEKDVALIVALKVAERLRSEHPSVTIVLTRSDDRFLELWERTTIANREHGDLFVSIHCDAAENRSAQGSTTYVMGKNHDDENQVALRENSVILLEENYEDKYEGFDPRKPESYIALMLYQNAFQAQSIQFAQVVQDEFRLSVGRRDRGVRQQPLYVTSRTSMPSALIELGFTTNTEEEDFLMSEPGQDAMADAIFRSISTYKARREAKLKPGAASLLEPVLQTQEKAIESGLTPTPAPAEVSAAAQVLGAVERPTSQSVYFTVQVTVSGIAKPTSDPVFSTVQPLTHKLESRLHKYYYGQYTSEEAAMKALTHAQKSGFPDAFIIAFKGEEKITLAEARTLLQNQ